MKKFLMSVLAGMFVACGALADSYTYTVSLGLGITNTSDALPVSGWLDKIEFSQTAAATCSVVVATYSGASAIDTYMTLANSADESKVVRTRFIGTGNTGTALAGVSVGMGTNLSADATTVLVGMYERPMIGGNTKIVTIGESTTNNVKVVIYYEPLKK